VTEAQKERQQALREAEMLSVQMRMALEEADVLTSRQHELQAALTRAQEQLVAGRHEWEAALAAAQAKGQQARQEAELFQARARAAQDEMAVLIRRRQSLETELDLAKTESLRAAREEELLQAQVRVMRQELDMSVLERQQLEQRLLQLSQGMESYQTQLTALQAERLALQRRAGEKERSLSAAGASLRDMEMQIHHLRDHLTRVKAEWKEAARLAEERQGLLEEKDNEMRRLLSSKSFRLTAPLRFFRSLLS
jgi:chromosome segregation ATPase